MIRARWDRMWQRLSVRQPPAEALEQILRAYSSPERHYHNLSHLQDCLSIFDQTHHLADHPEEVELAIWFHDAVYDTRRSDNEQRSAEWAEAVAQQAGLPETILQRVSDSILATRHVDEVTRADAQLLVDVDLSILGREPETFWRYETNIRNEYAWVPEDTYRQERLKILNRFLARPFIYYHHEYRDRFEEPARLNLNEAIARLGG